MGHGTLVDGVQRTVKNGFELVDGVQRKQKKGLTLVDGVQRDIGLTKMFTVTLTGIWNEQPCYVSIDGVKYYAAQTIEVSEGTEMYCRVFNMAFKGASAISLDGVGVATQDIVAGAYSWWAYTHTVTSDLTATGYQEDMATYSIEITTE